jgi:hypothetical protein
MKGLRPLQPAIYSACRLLIGRWSQLKMLVADTERLTYIRNIAERPIQ